MKKLIIFIMICALIPGLCACGDNTGDSILSNQFVIIKKQSEFGNDNYFLYDRDTKIVYLYTGGVYHATMCPYYTIVDGSPALAIYGVNYVQ